MTNYASMKNAELLAAWESKEPKYKGYIFAEAQARFGSEGIGAIGVLRLTVKYEAARADAARYKAQRDALVALFNRLPTFEPGTISGTYINIPTTRQWIDDRRALLDTIAQEDSDVD